MTSGNNNFVGFYYDILKLRLSSNIISSTMNSAQLNGNNTGKKNVPKVWSTPSFKALKNINILTSSKYLVEPLGRKLSLKF